MEMKVQDMRRKRAKKEMNRAMFVSEQPKQIYRRLLGLLYY